MYPVKSAKWKQPGSRQSVKAPTAVSRPAPLKVRLLNLSYGTKYQPLGQALLNDFTEVASRHTGTSGKVSFKQPRGENYHPAWLKIKAVIAALHDRKDRADWVIWLDSDTAIIDKERNPASLLPDDKDLLISADANGICSGIFAVRNTAWSRSFFKTLWFLGAIDPARHDEFDRSDRFEQNAMKAILRYFPSARAHIGIIPESLVMNRMSDYSENTWVFHFWMGGRTPAELIDKRAMLEARGWNRDTCEAAGRYDHQTWEDAVGVAERIQVSSGLFARYLGIPVGHKKLSPSEVDGLLRYANVFEFAMRAFRQKKRALRWLKTRNSSLSHRTPLLHVRTREGYDQVKQILTNLSPDVAGEIMIQRK